MIKRKITKDEFDALPEVMQAEYKPDASNAAIYLLDADDAKDAITARDKEKARADALQKVIDDAAAERIRIETERDEAIAKAAREKGDVTAIEKSWQKKIDDAKVAADAVIDGLKAKLSRLLVGSVAQQMAAEISTVPSLLAPVIERRLSADVDADTPATRVLDASGQASALSLEDLKKEFVANADFATIIKASNASGGSAGGQHGGGSAPGKKLNDMNSAERAQLQRENPAEFDRLVREARAAVNTNRLR